MNRDTFTPPVLGVDAAYREWGATCGPTAIAAALGLTLDQVRAAVSPDGRFKGYMGVRDIRAALERLGAKTKRSWSKPIAPVDVLALPEALAAATDGTEGAPVVVLLRFCGPWDSVPRAAATYRHAFAYRRIKPGDWARTTETPGWVCDANSRWLWREPDEARWLPARHWRNIVLAGLMPKRSNGCVAIDWMALVER